MSILAETSAAVIPTGTWTIDPTHSTVEFTIKHLGLATVKGRAVEVAGTIEGGDRPSIEGTVLVAGITTHDGTRDGHLRSPDFFDADRHPELRFASTSVELDGDELRVEGELTIKGVTKPVELSGTYVGAGVDPWGNERIGVDLAGRIDRNDFGVSWNAPLPGGAFLLPNDVDLRASFSAVKAA